MSATLDTRGVTHDPGTDWLHKRACTIEDAETFFPQVDERRPDRGAPDRDARVAKIVAYEKARAICRTCPVTRQCLKFALDTEGTARSSRAGVYAGTTPDQRHAIGQGASFDATLVEALAPLDMDAMSLSIRREVEARTIPCTRCDHLHQGVCDCGCGRAFRRFQPAACGTASAYAAHKAAGEVPCEPCFQAIRAKAAAQNVRRRKTS